MPNPTIKSYLEAGVQFTEMSKKQAEALVKALVKSGDVRRKDAEELVQSLVACGRETTEKISALVHSEVAKQMAALSDRFDDVEGRIESLTVSLKHNLRPSEPPLFPPPDLTAAEQAAAEHEAAKQAAKQTPVKKAAKKAPAKKKAAKKPAAKKKGGKKAPAKKKAGKQSSARRPTLVLPMRSAHRGSAGCRRRARHDLRVSGRRRLDAELVRRGLVSSRSEANALIDGHRVLVNGAIADKPARQVAPADQLVVSGPPSRFVGRGGISSSTPWKRSRSTSPGCGRSTPGASTGGFTDCLLQRGAASVVAVDVGHGQLHERLRADPRVENLERTNIRQIDAATIGGPVDLVVGDLSFISLRLVIAPLVAVCQPGLRWSCSSSRSSRPAVPRSAAGGESSPTPRCGPAEGRGGCRVHRRGCAIAGWTESPITGADGNREFLVHAVTGRTAP